MGRIPGTGNMVASIITNPLNGADIQADQDFTIEVRMNNFAPGTFTNPANTYYSAPQDLDGGGNIIGHTHVTVQDTGADTNPTQPLDSTQFVFFKGINTPANDQGLLTADVEGGLPAGNYRLCTMASSANHQPVLMPVAQRGAQDDCVRFTVGGNGGGGGGNNNGGNNGGDQGGDQNNGGGQGGDQNNGGDQGGDQNAGDQGGDQNNGGDQGGDQNAGDQGGDQNNGGDQGGDQNAGDQGGDQNAGDQGGDNNGGGNGGNGGNSENPSDNDGGNNNADGGDQTGSEEDSAGSGDSGAEDGAGEGTNGGNGGGNNGAIGGITAPEVTDTGDGDRPFGVNGNSFVNREAAVQRACDIQNNACSDAVNRGEVNGSTLADCNAQVATCVSNLS
jgi:hypothetical protein